MNAKTVRRLFGTGCLGTMLALPWVVGALQESPSNAGLNVCSLDDGQKAEPRTDAMAAWSRTIFLSPAPAGMSPQEPSEKPPPTAAPEDTPVVAPDAERPATVQNLRRADSH